MREQDPFADLNSTIDTPATPDPAFSQALRTRLLAELESDERVEAPIPLSRPTRIPITLQAVATILIVVGLTFSIIVLRDHNRSTNPSRITGMTTTTEVSLEEATLWESIPEGDVRVENSTYVLHESSVAVMNDVVLRVVSTTRFEGILAVDAETGAPLWQFAIPRVENATLTAGDGAVFVYAATGERDRALIRLDLATGEEVWSTDMYSFFPTMAWIDAGLLIWDGSSKLELYDGATGLQAGIRYFRRNSDALSSPLITRMTNSNLIVRDGVVAVGSGAGYIVALPETDVMGSEPLWQKDLEASVESLAVSEGVLAVGYNDNYTSYMSLTKLMGLDIQSGAELWSSDREGVVKYPIGVPGGFVTSFMPSMNVGTATPDFSQLSLEYFDAATGAVRWTQPGMLPASVTDDGATILGLDVSSTLNSAEIVALTTNDGTRLGTLRVAPYMGSSEIPVDEDRFYIITFDNRLLALSLKALTGD